MEFTSDTVLTIVRDDPMLARFHEETVRSLARLQAYGGYSRDDAVERFTKLVQAARLKLGFPLRRGRLSQSEQCEKHVAIDMLLYGFESTYLEVEPELALPPETQRVHHFTPPKNWKPRVLADLDEPLKPPGDWMPLEEDDPGFIALQDHEPDLKGVGESAYYICTSDAEDPRISQNIPGLHDPDAGLLSIEALDKDFQASIYMNQPGQDPHALLSWQSQSLLRRLDMQTYEDYRLEYAAEIKFERDLLAIANPHTSENGEKVGNSADEMWEDYLRRYPPLQRLELLKKYRGED